MQEDGSAARTEEVPLGEKLRRVLECPDEYWAPGWDDPQRLAAARGDGHLWRFIR